MSDPTDTNPTNNKLNNNPEEKQRRRDASDPIDIGIPSTSSQDRTQTTPTKNVTLPLWVAGSSPAKFFTLDDILKVNDSIEKMVLAHEIAIDPNFRLENIKKPKDPIEEAVQKTMKVAYWDKLKEDLERDPPDYSHCLVLLADIKQQTIDLLTEKNGRTRAELEHVLDPDLLRQQIERKVIDMNRLFHIILDVLSRLCAPVRDETIVNLRNEKDIVAMFRGIFDLLEAMHLDMANFTLSANRNTIEKYSAQFERDKFMKILEIDPEGAAHTKSVFAEALRDFLSKHPEKKQSPELSRDDVADIIAQVYMSLLEKSAHSPDNLVFPETLKLDEARIRAMGEKYLQLVITTAAVFIASNLAGKEVCETTNFKTELKNHLIVILNDISYSNYIDRFENIWLQCEKDIKKYVRILWSEFFAGTLKNQILELAEDMNPIRQIARERIYGFIFSIIRNPGTAPVRLPPGLSVVQSELAALTSRFLHVTNHNWKAFGTFYGEILDELFANANK